MWESLACLARAWPSSGRSAVPGKRLGSRSERRHYVLLLADKRARDDRGSRARSLWEILQLVPSLCGTNRMARLLRYRSMTSGTEQNAPILAPKPTRMQRIPLKGALSRHFPAPGLNRCGRFEVGQSAPGSRRERRATLAPGTHRHRPVRSFRALPMQKAPGEREGLPLEHLLVRACLGSPQPGPHQPDKVPAASGARS